MWEHPHDKEQEEATVQQLTRTDPTNHLVVSPEGLLPSQMGPQALPAPMEGSRKIRVLRTQLSCAGLLTHRFWEVTNMCCLSGCILL